MPEHCKTQYLVQEHGKPRKFTRRREGMLMDRNNEVIRLCRHADWLKLKRDWPEQVEADGLRHTYGWVLKEVS